MKNYESKTGKDLSGIQNIQGIDSLDKLMSLLDGGEYRFVRDNKKYEEMHRVLDPLCKVMDKVLDIVSDVAESVGVHRALFRKRLADAVIPNSMLTTVRLFLVPSNFCSRSGLACDTVMDTADGVGYIRQRKRLAQRMTLYWKCSENCHTFSNGSASTPRRDVLRR